MSMKLLLTVFLLAAASPSCRAFELQSFDAASVRAAGRELFVPVPAPERVERKSAGACAGYPLTMRLSGRTVTLPASGIWTRESHLATREDSFSGRAFPRSVKENISAHLAGSMRLLDRQARGAAYNAVYPTRWDHEWTPPENGKAGQGARGNVKPSKEEEMWIFNMMWAGKSLPKAGTKFLATYNGRSVVVVGGYERGPSSRRFLGGFQPEVLWYLGATEAASKVTLSALSDQGLQPGPVNCR